MEKSGEVWYNVTNKEGGHRGYAGHVEECAVRSRANDSK